MKDIVNAFSESSFSRSRWLPLGLLLGLLPHTLEEIRAKYNDDPEKCFYECLTRWLKGVDKVNESGGPTVESLANALNKIGEGFVATKITALLSNKGPWEVTLLLFTLYRNIVQSSTTKCYSIGF